eukprot:NODE_843_length_3569_cov_0.535447.p1 type:complete len:388 gc:universal NODE_843_length_3569_cov_0.535447:1515-352(-)
MNKYALQLPKHLIKPKIYNHSKSIDIEYNNVVIKKSLAWLRDHATQNILASGQKNQCSGQFYEAKAIKIDVEFKGEWFVNITWPSTKLDTPLNGIHQTAAPEMVSQYPLNWLIDTDRSEDIQLPEYNLWGSDFNSKIESLKVDYNDFVNSCFKECVNRLYFDGILVIKNCPPKTDTVEIIGQKFGPIYDTFYGKSWDVKNTTNAINVAYTAGELGLHMDLMYFKDPPGVQILHCLKNSAEGGANTFADCHYAANEVMQRFDEHYELTRLNVTYEYHSDSHWLKYSRPLITMENDKVQQVSYSPPFQGTLFGSTVSQINNWYKSMNAYERILSSNLIEFKLQDNEAVVFANNRIAHGRRAFTGDRHLRGTYVSWCSFLDTFRALNWVK